MQKARTMNQNQSVQKNSPRKKQLPRRERRLTLRRNRRNAQRRMTRKVRRKITLRKASPRRVNRKMILKEASPRGEARWMLRLPRSQKKSMPRKRKRRRTEACTDPGSQPPYQVVDSSWKIIGLPSKLKNTDFQKLRGNDLVSAFSS